MSVNNEDSANSRAEREKQFKKNDMLDAAEKLFFKKGVENVSIEEICKKSGYSRRTVYKYFGGKEAIYLEIIYRALAKNLELYNEDIKKFNPKNAYEKIDVMGKTFIRFYKNFPDYCTSIMMHKTEEAKSEQGKEVLGRMAVLDSQLDLYKLIEDGIEDGSIRNDVNAELLSITLFGGIIGSFTIMKNKSAFLTPKYKDNFALFFEDVFKLLTDLIAPKYNECCKSWHI